MHSFMTLQHCMDNRKLKNCQTSDLTLRPLSLCEGREGEGRGVGVEGLADRERERVNISLITRKKENQ